MSIQSTADRVRAAINHERAIEGLFDSNKSLAHASVQGTEDSVIVTIGRVEDFGPWLDVLPGPIFRSPAAVMGAELWVLNTAMETGDAASPLLPVFVACAVPVGASVVWDITQAVAA